MIFILRREKPRATASESTVNVYEHRQRKTKEETPECTLNTFAAGDWLEQLFFFSFFFFSPFFLFFKYVKSPFSPEVQTASHRSGSSCLTHTHTGTHTA